MKTLKDFHFKKKRVLVRCDFNVPLSEKWKITKGAPKILDDFRVKQTIPTIKYLLKEGARIILISHLGKPDSKHNKFSLRPIALRLEKLLGGKVKFLDDCIGKKVKEEIEQMKSEEIVLLENLRFYKEEEENRENFAKELSKLGDIYINDAFGVSHRAHASVVGIPEFLPSGAGLLLEKEIKELTSLIKNPKKPLVAIIGGKKVETKTKLINKISKIADFVLISGLINREIKKKKVVLNHPQKIIGPIDEVEGKDIGPQTISLFKAKVLQAKTVFWNGPVGMFEEKKFSKGSEMIAQVIIESGAFSVVGGGETVEFIQKLGFVDKFNHVSTGGGAMLEFFSGEELPGIKALK